VWRRSSCRVRMPVHAPRRWVAEQCRNVGRWLPRRASSWWLRARRFAGGLPDDMMVEKGRHRGRADRSRCNGLPARLGFGALSLADPMGPPPSSVTGRNDSRRLLPAFSPCQKTCRTWQNMQTFSPQGWAFDLARCRLGKRRLRHWCLKSQTAPPKGSRQSHRQELPGAISFLLLPTCRTRVGSRVFSPIPGNVSQ
jgi:hypothetical protein